MKDLPDDTYLMIVWREYDGDWFTGSVDVEEFDADCIRLRTIQVDTVDTRWGEPDACIAYIQGVEYWDGDNHITIENSDDTYQDVIGFKRIDFISTEDYKAWVREFEEE